MSAHSDTRAMWSPSLLLIILVLSIFAESRADVLDDLQDNSWTRIDSQLDVSTGILAFSGMTVDTENRKILLFGGGHNDYWGNEVWAFDIRSLQWSRMYEPDPKPDGISSSSFKSEYPGAVFYPDPNEPLSEARPLTRHTYDTVEFISSRGVMIVNGVFTWGSGQHEYCWRCDDTWTYDVTTNKWTYRTNVDVPNSEGAGSAYDPVSDKVYLISKKGGTSAYDIGTDKWTSINVSGDAPASNELVAEFDSKRRAIYVFGGEYVSSNELRRYDIESKTWTLLDPSGSKPPANGGYGMAYDEVNDVLLVFREGLWAYDPNQNSWTKMSSSPSPRSTDRVHGNFKYDPIENVAYLVFKNSNFEIETWAYRYKGGPPKITPKEPTDLTAQ